LWIIHSLDLCYAIVGDSALNIAVKLRTPGISYPIAYHAQMLPILTRMFLQLQHTEDFSIGCVDFIPNHVKFIPGDLVVYTVKFAGQTLLLKLNCVNCLVPCGPQSNLDFVHFVWTTFVYRSTNYAMLICPSRNADSKVLYTCHYKAMIGGTESRFCLACMPDPRIFARFGCNRPNQCTCRFCFKQPLSLKSIDQSLCSNLFIILTNSFLITPRHFHSMLRSTARSID
jgi:hypothetical protein